MRATGRSTVQGPSGKAASRSANPRRRRPSTGSRGSSPGRSGSGATADRSAAADARHRRKGAPRCPGAGRQATIADYAGWVPAMRKPAPVARVALARRRTAPALDGGHRHAIEARHRDCTPGRRNDHTRTDHLDVVPARQRHVILPETLLYGMYIYSTECLSGERHVTSRVGTARSPNRPAAGWSAGGDQLGHQRADAGSELEAVRREAELVDRRPPPWRSAR